MAETCAWLLLVVWMVLSIMPELQRFASNVAAVNQPTANPWNRNSYMGATQAPSPHGPYQRGHSPVQQQQHPAGSRPTSPMGKRNGKRAHLKALGKRVWNGMLGWAGSGKNGQSTRPRKAAQSPTMPRATGQSSTVPRGYGGRGRRRGGGGRHHHTGAGGVFNAFDSDTQSINSDLGSGCDPVLGCLAGVAGVIGALAG